MTDTIRNFTATTAAVATLLMARGLYANADAPADPVRWSAVIVPQATMANRGDATLEVSGVVADGWHVYALDQLPHGPTALRVTLEPNDIAAAAGPSSGTPAHKEFSASFGLETHYYNHTFAVRLPVHLIQQPAAGAGRIPLSVRFQACSERECLLPRTLHLTVPVDAPTGG